ncbi:NYN domain-containing protein [Lipingzhangella sp. LS1_29]|uniref:NYN domain-containing protein n=1 Tax=Lipingzhangella rawalii TaxID=2055835 RepID=A0ABU2HA77_9ACTN|nr:NYN domain-containing protein [Lipingzhangella rawalii]MDS1271504.1 NYN domain-containing protein [Lipingzhangella rawalii]
MDRCALFVDAGYLLADGAMAVHGTRNRDSVSWDYAGLVRLLSDMARDRTGLSLLRCYWYETTVDDRRNQEQDSIADIPGIKFRAARIRPGRREGVESYVQRDLTTLARTGGLCEAVLVSGDEDMAQVVADVQDLGVRVTVVHVSVEGNWTISRALRRECDDLIEVGAGHLRPYVNLLAQPDPAEETGSAGPLSNGQSHGAPMSRQPVNANVAADRVEPADMAMMYANTGGQPAGTAMEQLRAMQQSIAHRRGGDQPGAAGDVSNPATGGQPAPSGGYQAPAGGSPNQTGGHAYPNGASPQQAGGHAMPSGGYQAPAGGSPNQTGGHAYPNGASPQQAGGHAMPSGGYQAPAGGSPNQTGGHAYPNGASPQQAGGHAMPSGGYQAPAGGNPNQTGGHAMPSGGYQAQHTGGYPAQHPGHSGAHPSMAPQAGQGHPASGAQPSMRGMNGTGPQQPQQRMNPGGTQYQNPPTGAAPAQGRGDPPGRGAPPGQDRGYGSNTGQQQGFGGSSPVNPTSGASTGTEANLRGATATQNGMRPATGPQPTPPVQHGPYTNPTPRVGNVAPDPQDPHSVANAVRTAYQEGDNFGESIARDAPALWVEAVLAGQPRMPADLEARMLQGSALPVDYLLREDVRESLRGGFWSALERCRA